MADLKSSNLTTSSMSQKSQIQSQQNQQQNSDQMSGNFKTPLFDNLRKLVNVIDELRDVGLQEYIRLPRIAVVGSQSSGKSSLLENIVGLDFLPRGEGLVTRRPLEMRLVHVPGAEKIWAVFAELKDQKFFDFNKVRDTINMLTDKIAGQNKGIVNKPIILTIYSSICPDLTLIDLPGITRIPLQGSDQKDDIEKVTKDLVRSYIEDDRTIILCVIPANADISTSDGLQMARIYDKDGKRTIGCITKIDIMDRGTDARKMLLGQDVELKLGYIGVKNRSQADINSNMRVAQALDLETQFFAKHPVYSTMPPGTLGTKALTQKLSTVMFNHIRVFLPQIIKEINLKIKECEERLKDLGPALPSDSTERLHLIWNVIQDYTENFKNQLRGRYDGKRQIKTDSGNNLSGGAIIKLFFQDIYDDFDKEGYRPTENYDDNDIEQAIILHQGDSIPGFPSIDSFLYLIQPLLEQLKEPAQECLQNCFNYLEQLSTKLIDKLFGRFPQIIDDIIETANKLLQEERDKAKEVVSNIIEAELGYLFTNDYEYLMNRTNLVPDNKNKQQFENFDANKAFVYELRSRIDSYFLLVLRNIKDSIPKAIGYFLVKQSQEKMQFALYDGVMKNEEVLNQIKEPPHIAQERATVTKTLNILKKAQKVLKKDPDLAANYDRFQDGGDDVGPQQQQQQQQQYQQQRGGGPYQGGQQINPQHQKNISGGGQGQMGGPGMKNIPQQQLPNQKNQPPNAAGAQDNKDSNNSLFGM